MSGDAPPAPTNEPQPFALDVPIEGALRRRLFDVVRPALERALGLAELGRIYRRVRRDDLYGDAFLRGGLDALGVRIEVGSDELRRIPKDGPAVLVANHPFGAIEGMVLGVLLASVRSDSRIMANFILGRMPELGSLMLYVDPFEGRSAVGRNLAAMRTSLRWLETGGLLAVFPAGEVASFDPRRGRVVDPPWNPMIGALVRRASCPVVPVHFQGRNGVLFHALGLLHPLLRTALLPRELLRRRGKAIEVRVGRPIPFPQLKGFEDDRQLIGYLRDRTDFLGERAPAAPVTDADPVQPRRTPSVVQPIAEAEPADALEDEIARLPFEQRMVDAAESQVWIAAAEQIPRVLGEIGRLREITFRAVGEGTGRDRDLDVFDRTYLHLFLWNRRAREIVGAYRLGPTDRVLRDQRVDGLYTSTLFEYRPKLFEAMGPALEMGRSFIRPERQRDFSGLMLLWKGIGRYVCANPRYATLFGPVSISAEYRHASQRLIVAFLERNSFAHDWSRWVTPRTPFKPSRRDARRLTPAHVRDLEDVSTFISEIEADAKGVPILLRQYLKLGGRLLGFNVDPDFSNVLDVLIMVDLRRTDPKTLTRYMGREEAAAFLGYHRDGAARAG